MNYNITLYSSDRPSGKRVGSFSLDVHDRVIIIIIIISSDQFNTCLTDIHGVFLGTRGRKQDESCSLKEYYFNILTQIMRLRVIESFTNLSGKQ